MSTSIGTLNRKKAKRIYLSSHPVTEGLFQLVCSPFKVLKIFNFVHSQEFLGSLVEEISSLNFNRKENDLYSLYQTTDLNNVNLDSIKCFLSILKNEVQPLLAYVMNVPLNGKISVTASLYEKNDVLLCHDDKCEDRCIAFVFYLSGKNFNDGGAFEMFDRDCEGQPTNVVVSLPAMKNSFLCFEVGNYTYHQVSEIKTSSFKRLSINGWFHSEKALSLKNLKYNDPLPDLHEQYVREGLLMLDDYINISYCTPSSISQIRTTFEEESQICLKNFLLPSFYESCLRSLRSDKTFWKPVGPANRRKYEKLENSNLPEVLHTLCNILKSPLFVSFIGNLTGLSLEPFVGSNFPSTKMNFEIQRWKTSSYTMATDNENFFKISGLDMFLFFGVEELDSEKCGGYIAYLASDGDPEDSELLTIDPAGNSLYLVYRTNDTIRFVKYLNSQFKTSYYCIAVTYYEPSEIT